MSEQTKPGPVFTPAVDIHETDQDITLLADLPGVKAQDLQVDIRDNVLTLTAKKTAAAGPKETVVLRETRAGTFFRQFTLSEAIDQTKIEAALVDGVLRLALPKVEKHRPRQISVKVG